MTSSARRAQIVAATIEVLAAEGLAGATFARIAAEAGLSSTRLISYHFDGKDELLAAVAEHVVAAMGEHVGQRVGREETAAGMLRAYIEGVVGFGARNRSALRALLEVAVSGSGALGADSARATGHVEELLHLGQRRGEFRDFDVRIVASAVQRSVEALPALLAQDPGTDCEHYARELVTLFDLATRRGAP